MGGSDDKSNLVRLTPEEHYLAHQLLVRIYPENHYLALAALMMTVKRTSNKLYGWVRRRHSDAMSKIQSGEGNSQFGKVWIHNIETNEAKRIYSSENIPQGWALGRTPKLKEKVCNCRFCGAKFKTVENTRFCSGKCFQYHKSPAINTIDKNIETMVQQFVDCGSITKVLNSFGIPGRQGNSYFSSILKERGLKVLRRRNS
jgi:hypothetical protein